MYFRLINFEKDGEQRRADTVGAIKAAARCKECNLNIVILFLTGKKKYCEDVKSEIN